MLDNPFRIFEILIILYAVISLFNKYINRNLTKKIDKPNQNTNTYKNNLSSRGSKHNYNTDDSVNDNYANTSVQSAILAHTVLNNHFVNNIQSDSCNDSCDMNSGCDSFDGGCDC